MTKCKTCGGTGSIISPSDAAALRNRKGLTLKEVSTAMGVTISFLSDLEHGRRPWSKEWEKQFRKACS